MLPVFFLAINFVMYCVNSNYGGIENLALIPGTVGAAPIQNIGAYGVEVKNSIHEVHCFNIITNTMQVFTNNKCEFGYRDSVFKHALKNSLNPSCVNNWSIVS